MEANIRKGRDMIQKAKKIALFGHMSPDGDCIGAMLGLGRLLEKQKKQVKYFVPDKPSKVFDFIKHIKRIKRHFDYKGYDLLIFVDFTGMNRIGTISADNAGYFKDKDILIFDHHLGNGIDHGVMIKDVKSISTCEVIFEQTHERWPEFYDKDIATYLYLGITSDSGNFLFGEDHIRTFGNALDLLKLGADKDFVVDNLIRRKSLNSIRFLQLLLNRIHQEEGLLYTWYDENELEIYGIDQEEAAYGLHIIQNIDGPDIVLLMRKIGDTIKGSLRAKNKPAKGKGNKIDCNKIAQHLGGGGHRLASGFSIQKQGSFEHQIQAVVKEINKIARNP